MNMDVPAAVVDLWCEDIRRCKYRRDAVQIYRQAIRDAGPSNTTVFTRLNAEIVARWSGAALHWIKTQIWRQHEERMREQLLRASSPSSRTESHADPTMPRAP